MPLSRQFRFGYDPSYGMPLSQAFRPHSVGLSGDREVVPDEDTIVHLNIAPGARFGLVHPPQLLTSGWVYVLRSLGISPGDSPALLQTRYLLSPDGIREVTGPFTTPSDDDEARNRHAVLQRLSVRRTISLPICPDGWPRPPLDDDRAQRYWYWFVPFPDEVPESVLGRLAAGEFSNAVYRGRESGSRRWGTLPAEHRCYVESVLGFTFAHQALELDEGTPAGQGSRAREQRRYFQQQYPAAAELLTVVAPLRLGRARHRTYEIVSDVAHQTRWASRQRYQVAKLISGLLGAPQIADDIRGEVQQGRLEGEIRTMEQALQINLMRKEIAAGSVVEWQNCGAMFFAQAACSARDDAGSDSAFQLGYLEAVVGMADGLSGSICGREYFETLVTDRNCLTQRVREDAIANAYIIEHYIKGSSPSTLGFVRRARSAASQVLKLQFLKEFVIPVTGKGRNVVDALARIANRGRTPFVQRVTALIHGESVERLETIPSGARLLQGGLRSFAIAVDIVKVAMELGRAFSENETALRRVRAGVFSLGGSLSALSHGSRITALSGTGGRSLRLETWGRRFSLAASVFQIAEHGLAGFEAYDRGDDSVALGRGISALAAAGSCVVIGFELAGMYGVLTGPLGWIATGVALVGWGIYEWTQDTPFEQVARFSSFGTGGAGQGGGVTPHWAMGSLQELRSRPERQLRAFRNLLYCFAVTADDGPEVQRVGERAASAARWPPGAVPNLLIRFGSFTAENAFFEIEFAWHWARDGANDATEDSVRVHVHPGLTGDGHNLAAAIRSDGSRLVMNLGHDASSAENSEGGRTTALAARWVSRHDTGYHGLLVAPVMSDALRSRGTAGLTVVARVRFHPGQGVVIPGCQCGGRPAVVLYSDARAMRDAARRVRDWFVVDDGPVSSLGDDLHPSAIQRRSEGHG